jgi:hypothetical protein
MLAKKLSITNFNFRNEEERELFRNQEEAVLAERKGKAIADLKRDGLLDEDGKFVFEQDLPDDMKPESLADFKH